MDYQEFQAKIAEEIKGYLPEKYTDAVVRVEQITKNNGVTLDALQVMLQGEHMAPSIYLNEFYGQYQDGRSMENILAQIGKIRAECMMPAQKDVEVFQNFDQVKDKIIFRVIGADSNRDMLQKSPHRMENDMALVYRVLLDKGEEGTMSALVNGMLQKEWGVTEKELYDLALANTQREFPAVFRPMAEIMKEMMVKEFTGVDPASMDAETRAFFEEMFSDDMLDAKLPMYVLTNDRTSEGAAVLFYPEMKEQIAEKVGGDYFVLPSSVHEVLIVPDDGIIDFQELKNMVNEVNQTEVSPMDVLTGEVYFYDKEAHQLTVASERAEKAEERNTDRPMSIMDKLNTAKERITKEPGNTRLEPGLAI